VSLSRELSSAEEERILNRVANEVMKMEMEQVAIMFLESVKPIVFIGSQMGQFFIAPFLSIFGNLGIDYIKFFEKRENVEKLLQKLEEQIKIRDEDKRIAKIQKKLIFDKFGFQLDLLPSFLLQEGNGFNGKSSGFVRIIKKDSCESLAISFTVSDSTPREILNEIAANLDKENVRRALMLSQDVTLSLVGGQRTLNIRGHKTSMVSYLWNNAQGQKRMLETYGMWCNKSRRLFLFALTTGPLTGQKKENNQLRDLRYQLGSIKCH